MVHLPLEVLDQTIDYIVDNSTLTSCCLSARVFVHPCQKRLNRYLVLSADTSSWTRAAERFKDTPHLLQYIIELDINICTPWRSDVPPQSESTNFLSSLASSSLRRVSVGSTDWTNWSRLPGAVSQAILSLLLLRRPQTLTSSSLNPYQLVELCQIEHLPVDLIILAATATANLRLYSCIWDYRAQDRAEDSDLQALPANTSIRLDITRQASIAKMFLLTRLRIYLPLIRAITTWTIYDDYAPIEELYKQTSPTIESLEFQYGTDLGKLDGKYTLPNCWPRLRTVHVDTDTTQLTWYPGWVLNQSLANIFPVAASPSLSEISFLLHVFSEDRDPGIRIDDSLDWHKQVEDPASQPTAIQWSWDSTLMAAFDDVFSAHPKLKTVRWTTQIGVKQAQGYIEHPLARDVQHAACRDALEGALPLTKANGRLVIENSHR
ncbi:hypothetical protein MIND_00979500 [Mycena indigotica]|uniref:Uncharacterized protein n=1 Tax=Mycena indigotica TaxID=2126181 RepID=A0A8H6SEH3_9AGAR|nr:uncharacterized protein MIND_00979500 [Mycena indigotica]KAF7297458.1 hypothetical protein MIND_00979500 [Mycena indigotica]